MWRLMHCNQPLHDTKIGHTEQTHFPRAPRLRSRPLNYFTPILLFLFAKVVIDAFRASRSPYIDDNMYVTSCDPIRRVTRLLPTVAALWAQRKCVLHHFLDMLAVCRN